MNKIKRHEIFSRFQAGTLKPTSELKYDSTFELLISVLLSAQATDISVNKATAKLYPVANTPETIFALGVDGLSQYIKTIGLFPPIHALNTQRWGPLFPKAINLELNKACEVQCQNNDCACMKNLLPQNVLLNIQSCETVIEYELFNIA